MARKTNYPNPRAYVPDFLSALTSIANKATRNMFGATDCCILTSHALNNVLGDFKKQSRIVRITAHVFPKSIKHHGAALGWDGDGTRRSKAGKGMWHGHAGVLVDERWLLDATLDQVNNDVIQVGPVAIELDLDPGESFLFELGNCDVRYHMYRGKQDGFMHAPDARRSHWMPVACEMRRLLAKDVEAV